MGDGGLQIASDERRAELAELEASIRAHEDGGLYITYRDRLGAVTERVVTVLDIERRPARGGDAVVVVAWCHLRGAVRTFFLSRMIWVDLVESPPLGAALRPRPPRRRRRRYGSG